MADIAELLALQLKQGEQDLYRSDPFYSSGRALQGLQFPMYGRGADPRKAAIATGISAALGGLLSGIGRNRQQENVQRMYSQVNNALNTPGGLENLASDPRFGMAAQAGMLQQKLQQQQQEQELKNRLQYQKDLMKETGPLEREHAAAMIRAETPALLERQEKIEKMKHKYAPVDTLSPLEIAKEVRQEAAQLGSSKAVANFIEVKDYFNTMLESYKLDNSAADVALANAFVKIFDPTSRVTEKEFEVVMTKMPIRYHSFIADMAKIYKEKGQIPRYARERMIEVASKMYESRQETFEKLTRAAESRAFSYRGDPRQANPYGHYPKVDKLLNDYGVTKSENLSDKQVSKIKELARQAAEAGL